jgi:hypothetical protein
MTTYHGGPMDSMQNAIIRALRREYRKEQDKQRGRPNLFVRMRLHSRNTEAYNRVVEERERLGIPPPRRSSIPGLALKTSQYRKITVTGLPGKNDVPKSPRERVEDQALKTLAQSIEALQSSLLQLARTPNPHSTFHNRISQQLLVKAIRALAYCASPPLPFNEDFGRQRPEQHHGE